MHDRTEYEKANYTECEKAKYCAMYDNKLPAQSAARQIIVSSVYSLLYVVNDITTRQQELGLQMHAC